MSAKVKKYINMISLKLFYLISVNKYSQNYAYRAYLTDVVSYDALVKGTQMIPQGFNFDPFGYMESTMNGGWQRRRGAFLASTKTDTSTKVTTETWREDPVPFIGRLHTDFDATQQGR